jgi:hypothetical protein
MIAADRAVDLSFQRLSGDSTLSALVGGRIGRAPIIPAAAGLARFPYLDLGIQSNTPLETIDASRVWENMLLRVSIYATAGQGWGVVRQIKDRVDTLMQGYRGTTGGAEIGKYRLESSTDMVEDDAEGQKLHSVLLYRSLAREA